MWEIARNREKQKYEDACNRRIASPNIDASKKHSFSQLEKQNFEFSFPSFPEVLGKPRIADTEQQTSTDDEQISKQTNQELNEEKEISSIPPLSDTQDKQQNEEVADVVNPTIEIPSEEKETPKIKEKHENDISERKRREFTSTFIEHSMFEWEITKQNRKRPTRKEIVKSSIFPKNLLDIKLFTRPVADRTSKRGKRSEKAQSEVSLYIIEKIIGCTNPASPKSEQIKYYTKYLDVAYVHCEFLLEEQVLLHEGGKAALDEFKAACSLHPLIRSNCLSNLLVLDNSELDPMWFSLDRVIDESNDDNSFEYLAKWSGLEYDQSTWESVEAIASSRQVNNYQQRITTPNSKHIPSRWKRPTIEQFQPVLKPDNSLTGLVFQEHMVKVINVLMASYFENRNIIHSSKHAVEQRSQVTAALDYLTNEAKFNGPILLLTVEENANAWREQFDEWTGFNAVVYQGTQNSLKSIVETEFTVVDQNGRNVDTKIQADVIITSFELFKSSQSLLGNLNWRVFILDATKNTEIDEKIFTSIKAEYTIVTIDQLPNTNIFSIWNYLHFVAPLVFDDQDAFKSKYYSTDFTEDKALNDLVSKYLVCIDEKFNTDNYHMIEVEPSVDQTNLASELIMNNKSLLMNPKPCDEGALRYILSLLRLISDHPLLFANKNYSARELIDASGKLQFIEKLLKTKNALKRKYLIFSEIPDSLDIIEMALSHLDFKYIRITATETDDNFDQIMDKFDENESENIILFSSKHGARKIDTSIFTTIILYDDDTFHLRASPFCHVYHLVTRGFPDESLATRNMCYDENIMYDVSTDGPFPVPWKHISTVVLSAFQRLCSVTETDRALYKGRTFEDLGRTCGRILVGKRKIDLSLQYNEYGTPTPEITSVHEMIQSIHDIGPRNRVFAYQVIKQAMYSFQPTETISKKILKVALMKVPRLETKYENTRLIKEYAKRIIYDATFYLRIQHALQGLAKEVDFPETEDVLNDYTMLYHFFMSGITKTLQMVTEGTIKSKCSSPEELFNYVNAIVEKIEEKYTFVDPQFADFKAMSPERWINYYPEVKKYRDEAEKMFMDIINTPRGRVSMLKSENKEYSDEDEQVDNEPIKEEIQAESTAIIEQPKKEEKPRKKKTEAVKVETEKTQAPQGKKKIIKPEKEENKEENRQISLALAVYIALLDRGVPQNKDDDTQWETLLNAANLKCDKRKFKKIALEHIKIAIKTIGDEEPLNISKNQTLKEFAPFYTLEAAHELLYSIHMLEMIYSCVNNFRGDRTNIFKKLSVNGDMPKWWNSDLDKNFLTGIAENGSFSFFKWIIDPKYGFKEFIPQAELAEFTKAAAKEEKRILTQEDIPTSLGDFALLANRRYRLEKASWVVNEISKIMFNKRKINLPKTSSPQYLLEPSEKLKIISFGQLSKDPAFNRAFYPLPIGFVSERLFKGNDGVSRWYRCEINNQMGAPLFSVQLKEDPKLIWYGSTTREVWTLVSQHWKKQNIPRIAGTWLFGLVNAKVLEVFCQMTKSKNWRNLPDTMKPKSLDDSKLFIPEE